MSNFMGSPRTPHLLRLWTELCQNQELPQVDRWLKFRFKEQKSFGSKDRRWYSEAIFTALRHAVSILAAEKPLLQNLSPKECWDTIRKIEARDFFTALDRELTNTSLSDDANPSLHEAANPSEDKFFRAGVPPFYARHLEQTTWSVEEKERFLAGLSQRVPLWLRLNHENRRAACEQELTSLGIVHQWFGQALALPEGTSLAKLDCFQKGWLEIQDFASQEVGEAVPLAADSLVWDCCAGGGGKTLQLAARGAGRVFASDVRRYKLEDVRSRAERAGFSNIKTLPWNGTHDPEIPSEVGKRGGFDLILVDAPCSGSGTWRRSPDARFRLDTKSLTDLAKLQYSILCRVSPHLRPGGTLVYATCSWLPEENEAVVKAFQKAYPQFELLEQKLCGWPRSDADTLYVASLKHR